MEQNLPELKYFKYVRKQIWRNKKVRRIAYQGVIKCRLHL